MASPRSAGTGSMGDEAIWRKLREAGFDEDAVRRRDKATLVAYITRLETEVIFLSPRLSSCAADAPGSGFLAWCCGSWCAGPGLSPYRVLSDFWGGMDNDWRAVLSGQEI
jgi:hypothetical protein